MFILRTLFWLGVVILLLPAGKTDTTETNEAAKALLMAGTCHCSAGWDREGCERAVEKASSYGMDFLEIALLRPDLVDTEHSRRTLAAVGSDSFMHALTAIPR